MSAYIHNSATTVVKNNGRIVIQGKVQDYDPTANTTNTPVLLQLDGGYGLSQSTTRAGGDRQVTWTARRSGKATTLSTIALNDPIALCTQDGRTTLAFSAEGAGLSGTWGPFASATFTLMVVVRLDRIVSNYGTVPGMGGTLTLLSSPNLMVAMPIGGASVPLDAMFLNTWRILSVRNNATERTTSIDNKVVNTMSPSTSVVTANETFILAAAFPGEIAELIVWNGTLSTLDLTNFAYALSLKWNTAALPSVPRYTIPNTTGVVWPTGVPAPTVWLDAAHPASLFADTIANIATVTHGRVARWLDRSGNGHNVTFNNMGQTYWATGGAEQINGLPVVAVSRTDIGTFVGGNPLIGAVNGAFTVLAVWRMNGSGGHPFCIEGRGSFTSDEWVDALGTNSYRLMPAPKTLTPFSIGPQAVVMMAWERSALGVMQIRVYNLSDTDSSGSKFTESGNTDKTWLSKAVTIGSNTKGLQLAELMVWSGTVLDNTARGNLRGYLVSKWGDSILPHTGGMNTTALPTAVVAYTATVLAWDASNISNLIGATGSSILDGNNIQRWIGTIGPHPDTNSPDLFAYSLTGLYPTYAHDTAGRPGVRTKINACLGNSTPALRMIGRTIGLVCTHHSSSNTGYPLFLGRRLAVAGVGVGNSNGQWLNRLDFVNSPVTYTYNAYNGINAGGVIRRARLPINQCIVSVFRMYRFASGTGLIIDECNSWTGNPITTTTVLLADGTGFADDTSLPLHVGGYFNDLAGSTTNSETTFHEIHIAHEQFAGVPSLYTHLAEKWL